MKYTCNMIEDLIPLAAEGLCSDESRAAVEAHIAECENCRKLYQQPVGAAATVKVQPDEAKAFRKVHKTLTKHKWLDRILLVLLAVVVLGVGVLFYGQITHQEGCESFDTLLERARVRKIARLIAAGDVEGFLPYLSAEGFGYDSLYMVDGMTAFQQMGEACKQPLREAYARDFEGAKVKKITTDVQYLSTYTLIADGVIEKFSNRNLYSYATVEMDNGRRFRLSLGLAPDGRYSIYVYNAGGIGAPDCEYYEIINFLSEPDVPATPGYIEKLLMNPRNSESGQDTRYHSLGLRFSETVREQIKTNLKAFETQYRFTFVELSPMQYDKDQNELFWTMTLEAEDAQGKALLLTRFTRDFTGLVPQDAALNTVYTEGCSAELADALRNLF